MSKHPDHISSDSDREQIIQVRRQIAQAVRRRLVLLLSLLIAIVLVVTFKIGGSFWPAWLVTHRTQMIASLALVILVVFFSSPLIIEASSNPRPLSGPGGRPGMGHWK